jgi:hypothetical protein
MKSSIVILSVIFLSDYSLSAFNEIEFMFYSYKNESCMNSNRVKLTAPGETTKIIKKVRVSDQGMTLLHTMENTTVENGVD